MRGWRGMCGLGWATRENNIDVQDGEDGVETVSGDCVLSSLVLSCVTVRNGFEMGSPACTPSYTQQGQWR